MYGYDRFGWYVGEVDASNKRSTDLVPTNLTLSAEPGVMRANWTGAAWQDLPYQYHEEIVVAPVAQKINPIEFKLRFTPQERIAIKAARATDPVIDDWYEMLDDPRLLEIDVTESAVTEVLDYLVSVTLITAARKQVIISGEQ